VVGDSYRIYGSHVISIRPVVVRCLRPQATLGAETLPFIGLLEDNNAPLSRLLYHSMRQRPIMLQQES